MTIVDAEKLRSAPTEDLRAVLRAIAAHRDSPEISHYLAVAVGGIAEIYIKNEFSRRLAMAPCQQQ